VDAAPRRGRAELPIYSRAAARVADSPFRRRGPFDRFSVAQAMTELARLLTADARLRADSELVLLVGWPPLC